LLERGFFVQEGPAMKSRHSAPRAHPKPVLKSTEWDVVTKPTRPRGRWQAEASFIAVMYAAALAVRRRARPW
jgi:hypothetical protein